MASIPLHDLYVLKGEAGPMMERVKGALAWLVSPKAEGIGEKLLREAHTLHGKPLHIEVSSPSQNQYRNLGGEHKLVLNPTHLDLMRIKDAGGGLRPVSTERLIAHELTHAGQPITQELYNQQWQLQQRMFNELTSHLPEAERVALFEPIERALEADSAEAMRPHIERYLDRAGAFEQKAKEMLATDPEYQAYIRNFEHPAIENENHVAQILGEPIRTDYLKGYEISPEAERKMAVDGMTMQFLEMKQIAKQEASMSTSSSSSSASYASSVSSSEPKERKWELIAASTVAAVAALAGGIGYIFQSQKQHREAKKSWVAQTQPQTQNPAQSR